MLALLNEEPASVSYIDHVPCKRPAPPIGTIEPTWLRTRLISFSSEMHKGTYAPPFYNGIVKQAKVVLRLVARMAVANAPQRTTVPSQRKPKTFKRRPRFRAEISCPL
jgi:hypothetical protein